MKRFFLVLAMLLVCAAGYGIYCLQQLVYVQVPNAYAMDWGAAMVIEYMKSNQNEWPSSWEDLRAPYETLAAPQNYPWSFEEIQQRLTIDWKVDPNELATANPDSNGPPFRVIWLSDGSESHWQGAEPNHSILEYLMETGGEPSP